MDILSFINKKLVLERLVIGIQEPVLVKGLGELTAKVDSGNGGLNVIHGDNFVLQGDTLLFDTKNDKGETRKLSKKVVGYIDVNIGGGNIQHRPIIELDIKFADTNYKKIKFSVTDRTTNDTLILMSKSFVQDELDALIDVSAINLTKDGTLEAEIVSEALNTGTGIKTEEKKKGFLGKIADKANKINDTFKKATNVFKAVGGDRNVSLFGALDEFVNSLYGVDKIKSFLSSLGKDQYYKADKPKIIEAANRKATELKALGVDTTSEPTIIKIVDFTGNGWDDNATQQFQGKVPFVKMGDAFKNACQPIDDILGDIGNKNTQEANNTQQANESFIIKEADAPQPAIAGAVQPTQPAQNAQSTQPNQSDATQSTQDDEASNEQNNAAKTAKSEYITSINNKVEELKNAGADSATIFDELNTLKETVKQDNNLDTKDKEEIERVCDKKLVELVHDKIASIKNFIIYYANYSDVDYENILKSTVLTEDITSLIIKIFEGNADSTTIDNVVTALQKKLDEGIKNGLKGYFALATGDVANRTIQLYLPLKSNKSSDSNSTFNSEAKASINKIINAINLANVGTNTSNNEKQSAQSVQLNDEQKNSIGDIIVNIELPGTAKQLGGNTDDKNAIDNIKIEISNAILPKLPESSDEKNTDKESNDNESAK